MAAAKVIRAIELLIRDNWKHCDIRGFDEPPESAVPSDMGAFAEITFPVEPEEEQISFGAPGNNVFREVGGFHFCVFVPKYEYLPKWAEFIDDLRDELRNWRSTDGHMRVFETPSPAINDRSDREGYRELSIAVPYEYDIFR